MSGPKHTPSVTDWEYNGGGGFIEGRAPGYGSVTIAEIRGYGYLTGQGPGALGLPQEYAEAIQDGWGRKMAAAPRLAEELAAWRAWAERWGRDIETSLSISPTAHSELVERLAATNAALREAEGS